VATDQQRTDTSKESGDWRGRIGTMSDQEVDAFLAEDHLSRLAVLDDRGWPYVQPIWFQWDPSERVFWIVARKKSAWAHFIVNDARVAMTVDGNTRPYKKITVQGTAELVETPNIGGRWVEIARKMALRYLGEHGPDYIVPTLDKPRWLFKINPEVMTTWQGVDWHPRYKED
jgi:nitroimidazol reductase NimA-like FMN-containing flavoprotein (pyridoxamine 5'-phosphate oxidase superfamily)